MPATIEYRGVPALEYAAQTGAQLLRQRRAGDPLEPIDAAVAHALWKFGAAQQIVCIAVDHRALAATQPYPGWAASLKRLPRKFARVSRKSARRLGILAEQVALFARISRSRALASHAEN
jgi:hypothetical protein